MAKMKSKLSEARYGSIEENVSNLSTATSR